MGRVKTKVPSTKISAHKKTHSKNPMGTCYLEKNCKVYYPEKLLKPNAEIKVEKAGQKQIGRVRNYKNRFLITIKYKNWSISSE